MNVLALEAILHHPRNFLSNRFVYVVISQRAGGLSIGINMNPDQACNFDCAYCEVKRVPSNHGRKMDVAAMSKELTNLLCILQLGRFHELPGFANVPAEFMQLKNIALSGDGEPTLSEHFCEVIEEVSRVREMPQLPLFKLVLITNATGLHLPPVQDGLQRFSRSDEVWVKLDAGTPEYMAQVNKTRIPLDTVLGNILALARRRPVVVQSLFCSISEHGPRESEIDAYLRRLLELKEQGAQISRVQIYSVVREPAHPGCTYLPLSRISQIARRVREETGLPAEAY